jgi:hypothetical protein
MFRAAPETLWPYSWLPADGNQLPLDTPVGASPLNSPFAAVPSMFGADVVQQPPWGDPQRHFGAPDNWSTPGPDFLRGPAATNLPPSAFYVAPPTDTTSGFHVTDDDLSVPGFHVPPPPDMTPGFHVIDDDLSKPGFRVGNDRIAQGMASNTDVYFPLKYEAPYGGNLPFNDSVAATPQYPSLQEALDPIARLYGGVASNPFLGLDPQRAEADASTSSGLYGLPIGGNTIDPSYIIPAQSRVPPPPPPRTPGIGDNNPPATAGRPNPIGPFIPGPAVQAPPAQRPPIGQPPPDTAGPAAVAAAAAAAAEQRRAEAFGTSREQLKALDPENPLLKAELAQGAAPDQATVDRQVKEVEGLALKRFNETLDNLSAESTYQSRSRIRTIGGGVNLRSVFDYLKTGGTRTIMSSGGQYGEGRDGEFYKLPGGATVGFRMANNTTTGEKSSIPTLDITVPGRGMIRFHYNEK